MNKYNINQGINFIVFLFVCAILLKGCLSIDYVGLLVGPEVVEEVIEGE